VTDDPLAVVRQRLRTFAEAEAQTSPLYAHLAGQAAEDDEVAGLLLAAPLNHARPTLLLAAVHRLLAAAPVHPLSRYYPTMGGFDGVDDRTWPLFRSFVLERADEVRRLCATRFTQTNEVQRSALLYPAVAAVAKRARSPIALLEVGTSAGLLLGLDRYRYEYSFRADKFTAGPAKAALSLSCAVDGDGFTQPPKKLAVGARLGLDQAPVDLADEEQFAWLEACVWPDQLERVRLLHTAAAVQRRDPPELMTGDAVDDLPAAVGRLPGDLPLVVLTSHATTYLERPRREQFVATLTELARQRPLWWVASGPYESGIDLVVPGRDGLSYRASGLSTLAVTEWVDGQPRGRVLAQHAHHGKRMTWLG
jgi:hypothetical protein